MLGVYRMSLFKIFHKPNFLKKRGKKQVFCLHTKVKNFTSEEKTLSPDGLDGLVYLSDLGGLSGLGGLVDLGCL